MIIVVVSKRVRAFPSQRRHIHQTNSCPWALRGTRETPNKLVSLDPQKGEIHQTNSCSCDEAKGLPLKRGRCSLQAEQRPRQFAVVRCIPTLPLSAVYCKHIAGVFPGYEGVPTGQLSQQPNGVVVVVVVVVVPSIRLSSYGDRRRIIHFKYLLMRR